jgi:propanol-preferring alcohol dehydrogenase
MLLKNLSSLELNPNPLVLENVPRPEPAANQVLLRVSACGVCHTELDEIEGRTPPPSFPVIPGHEIVGRVVQRGEQARRFSIDQRVGVGWIFQSDGTREENLSPAFRATGRDADGGYAEFMVVREDYAYPIPDCFSDAEAAPLLCAGSVGYRALKMCRINDGDVLGLTGFGGSGHLVLQLARYLYPQSPVLVFARNQQERSFARELGASWTGDTLDTPMHAPDAIIDTTPAWQPVLAALRVLKPGGRLVINAIRKEDRDRHLMSTISYPDHLWQEKQLCSVANITRDDIRDCLAIAAESSLRIKVECFALDQANRALHALSGGGVRGAKVLMIEQ